MPPDFPTRHPTNRSLKPDISAAVTPWSAFSVDENAAAPSERDRATAEAILQWFRGNDESQWAAQTRIAFRHASRPIIRPPKPDVAAAGLICSRPEPLKSTPPRPTCEECWLRCGGTTEIMHSNMAKQLWSCCHRDEIQKNSAGFRKLKKLGAAPFRGYYVGCQSRTHHRRC